MEEIINKLTSILQEIEASHGVVHNANSYDHVKQLHQQAKGHIAELRKMVAEAKLVEAQAEYIRKKGYLAYVIPPRPEGFDFYIIHLRKIAAGQVVGVDWAISPLDLQYSLVPKQILTEQADERIEMIRRAIAERTGEQ